MRTRIAVTLGDPRGIGPEVAFQAVAGELPPGVDLTLFGSDALGPQVPAGCDFVSVGGFDGSEQDAGNVSVLAIQRAVESAMRGEYRALVTAPGSKPALRAAGRDVPGQTELLQQLTGCESVGMLMAAERTRLGPPLRHRKQQERPTLRQGLMLSMLQVSRRTSIRNQSYGPLCSIILFDLVGVPVSACLRRDCLEAWSVISENNHGICALQLLHSLHSLQHGVGTNLTPNIQFHSKSSLPTYAIRFIA